LYCLYRGLDPALNVRASQNREKGEKKYEESNIWRSYFVPGVDFGAAVELRRLCTAPESHDPGNCAYHTDTHYHPDRTHYGADGAYCAPYGTH
jgi:hypothetical protein